MWAAPGFVDTEIGVTLEPTAVFVAPAVVAVFGNLRFFAGLADRSALCHKHFDLPQLHNDLLGAMSLSGHLPGFLSKLIIDQPGPKTRTDHGRGSAVEPRMRHELLDLFFAPKVLTYVHCARQRRLEPQGTAKNAFGLFRSAIAEVSA